MDEQRWEDACPKLTESYSASIRRRHRCSRSPSATRARARPPPRGPSSARRSPAKRDNRPNRGDGARAHGRAEAAAVLPGSAVDVATGRLKDVVIKRATASSSSPRRGTWPRPSIRASMSSRPPLRATRRSFSPRRSRGGRGHRRPRASARAGEGGILCPCRRAGRRRARGRGPSATRAAPCALRIGSYAAGGIGLALLGAGSTYFSFAASPIGTTRTAGCPAPRCSNRDGVDASHDAAQRPTSPPGSSSAAPSRSGSPPPCILSR